MKKTTSKKTTPKRPATKRPSRQIRAIVSIPRQVVLEPSPNVPPLSRGQDLSQAKTGALRELSWMQFDGLVQSLAQDILASFHPDAVVGVAHGGVFVGGALARALRVEFFPVRISRRSRDHGPRPGLKMYGHLPKELKGRKVLIVDDVAASGETLNLASHKARELKARSVKTLALVTKEAGFQPDFSAWVTNDFVVFPWDYEDVTEDARFEVDPDTAGA